MPCSAVRAFRIVESTYNPLTVTVEVAVRGSSSLPFLCKRVLRFPRNQEVAKGHLFVPPPFRILRFQRHSKSASVSWTRLATLLAAEPARRPAHYWWSAFPTIGNGLPKSGEVTVGSSCLNTA